MFNDLANASANTTYTGYYTVGVAGGEYEIP